LLDSSVGEGTTLYIELPLTSAYCLGGIDGHSCSHQARGITSRL
jgi:hypothetical protein